LNKKNTIYYWASDLRSFTGEGILANHFLSDIKKYNKNFTFININKNNNNYHINDLDIRDILQIYESKYKSNDFILKLCIVIRNKDNIYKLCKNANHTSSDLVSIIRNKSTIIIDCNDLFNIFKTFIYNFKNIHINKLIKINKSKIILKWIYTRV